jgi:23S rRNA U2552 (ribose-2'-O)-methylase RlmE/FtsJ
MREGKDKTGSIDFRNQFRKVFQEMCTSVDSPLCEGIDRFIDLGCAPGGFSKGVLGFNKHARGLGVTLPFDEHGLPMIMEDWTDNERARYELCEFNLLHLPKDFDIRVKSFLSGNRCDLVICGAVYRDSTTLQPQDTVPSNHSTRIGPTCRTILRLRQLSIAFRYLKKGGALVSVAKLNISVITIKTLLFLRSHFAHVSGVKSPTLHGGRSTYYLVCQGFQLGYEEKIEAILYLEHLEQDLAGTDGDGDKVSLAEAIGLAKLVEETEYLLSHFEPLWKQQMEFLEGHLEILNRRARQRRSRRSSVSGDWRRTTNANGIGIANGES